MPKADDLEGWKAAHALMEKQAIKNQGDVLSRYRVTVRSMTYGGIPALLVTPKSGAKVRGVILYTHGGAYTMLSARSTLAAAAAIADAASLPVVSVDYTNPPRAKWRQVIGEVIRAYRSLISQGYRPGQIVFCGDSAGGALAAGAVLALRDRGLPTPAALVLWSPWADITETGESYVTLKAAEPRYIYEKVLKPSADAYADPAEQKHPYVSPVYGHFDASFPPTLIQGGTREIFLSNFVRLYQAMDQAGVSVKLDLYEGMPHVFQATLPDSSEARVALKKTARFILGHLNQSVSPHPAEE
jgi:acetyl esterase/lipase